MVKLQRWKKNKKTEVNGIWKREKGREGSMSVKGQSIKNKGRKRLKFVRSSVIEEEE